MDPSILFHWPKHLDYQDLVGLAHLGDLNRGQFRFVIPIWQSLLLYTSCTETIPLNQLPLYHNITRYEFLKRNFEERTYCPRHLNLVLISFFFFLDKDGIIFSVPWESKIIEYFVLPTRVTHAEIRYLLTSIIFWMTLDVFSFVVFVIACLFLFFSFSRVTEVFPVVFVSMNSFFYSIQGSCLLTHNTCGVAS